MIVTINWNEFKAKGYLSKGPVFVYETEKVWEIYGEEGHFILKCVVEKSENVEENMMFVERHFMGWANITRALTIEPNGHKPKPEPILSPATPEEEIEDKNLNLPNIVALAEPNPALADYNRPLSGRTGELEEKQEAPADDPLSLAPAGDPDPAATADEEAEEDDDDDEEEDEDNDNDNNDDEQKAEFTNPSLQQIRQQIKLSEERQAYNDYTINKGETPDYVDYPKLGPGYIDPIPKFNQLNNKETDNKERYSKR